jgi:hypothetical protein
MAVNFCSDCIDLNLFIPRSCRLNEDVNSQAERISDVMSHGILTENVSY